MVRSGSILACTLICWFWLTTPAWADPPRQLPGHGGAEVTALAFSPDGKVLVSAGMDGHLHILDVKSGRIRFDLELGGRRGLAFSPDGKTIAAAGSDHTIRLLDADTGKEKGQLKGHTGIVAALAFAPDGVTLASGSYDHTIRLWNVAAAKELRRFQIPKARITALAFTAQGKKLVSGGTTNALQEEGGFSISTGEADFVRIWDVAGKEDVQVLRQLQASRIALSPDGRFLAGGGHGSDIRRRRSQTSYDGIERIAVLDLLTGGKVFEWTVHGVEVAFSPKDNLLATANGNLEAHLKGFGFFGGVMDRWDGRVRLWDLAKKKEVLRLPPTNIMVLAFAPDGKKLATGSAEGDIVVWDLEAEKIQPTPDPLEIIRKPPAENKILTCIHNDFEALLRKETDPEPFRQACLLLQRKNWPDAVELLRKHRSPTGVALVLRFLADPEFVKDERFDWTGMQLTRTFVVLSGKEISAGRKGTVKMIETWWNPNKEKVSTDLAKMSVEQWEVIADDLAGSAVRWRNRESPPFYGWFDQYDNALEPDGYYPRFFEQDLHPGMIPILLAEAGFAENPPKGERETFPVAIGAVPLLGRLYKQGRAKDLDKIALDARQNSAVRLTCLLALFQGGEPLDTKALVALLKEEKKLNRRGIGILALENGSAELAVPFLLGCLDDPNQNIRTAAVEALRRFRPPAALPRLARLLDQCLPYDRETSRLLVLIAETGTKEGQTILAGFLRRAVEEPGQGRHLGDALECFEAVTGQRRTSRSATDFERRQAARRVLALWIQKNAS